MRISDQLLRALGRAARTRLRSWLSQPASTTQGRRQASGRHDTSPRDTSHHDTGHHDTGPRGRRGPHSAPGTPPPFAGAYPGDFTGMPTIAYAPHDDDRPDPGEVVWTWVPYEEDASVGKDRPVLVIGLDDADPGREWLLAAQLTSKDHDRDAAQEASQGRFWLDIGTGEWDARHRPSEVRLDRIVRIDARHVRRTGGRLDRQRFDRVAAEIRAHR